MFLDLNKVLLTICLATLAPLRSPKRTHLGKFTSRAAPGIDVSDLSDTSLPRSHVAVGTPSTDGWRPPVATGTQEGFRAAAATRRGVPYEKGLPDADREEEENGEERDDGGQEEEENGEERDDGGQKEEEDGEQEDDGGQKEEGNGEQEEENKQEKRAEGTEETRRTRREKEERIVQDNTPKEHPSSSHDPGGSWLTKVRSLWEHKRGCYN
ncbi:hypothetical protein NDU88_000774 [Pleurodeles waltl]|uniref:Uncharacterized protein n=1 Tax=Pleurodeles waltl TaxID=8319 RepID=A0AAV7KQV2_PLEWA|nr:hypothetical protein NDU88_000774 [Pleurodeles waltl]